MSRAVIAKFQTGSGKGGFLSGFASSLLGGTVMEKFGDSHVVVKVTMAAIAGGTASALGGGKFANGAMAGAFIMMFNDLMKPKIMGGITKEMKDKARYFTPENKMARGLAIHQDMQEYSKPMMAAGMTGIAVITGTEVLYPLVMRNPVASYNFVTSSLDAGWSASAWGIRSWAGRIGQGIELITKGL